MTVVNIKQILVFLLLFMVGIRAYSHVSDEVAIRSEISLEENSIFLKLKIDAGMIFGRYYLLSLDPDQNGIFEDKDILKFSEFVTSVLKITMDNSLLFPELQDVSYSSFEEMISGLFSLELRYKLPYPDDLDSAHILYYENCLEAEIAIYTLHISDGNSTTVKIIESVRNEILQDSVNITFCNKDSQAFQFPSESRPEELKSVLSEADSIVLSIKEDIPGEGSNMVVPDPPVSFSETELRDTAMLLEHIRSGDFNPFILLLLAVLIGFLHAFTPGHGKSLVGAYLIANRGTVSQALGLGLIVAITHTASIYILGGLASVAAYFFMPSSLIPLMTIVSGVFIVTIGVWSVVRRLFCFEVDHAHILPNLKVLKNDYINILLDGSSVDFSEYLIIESENDSFQEQLEAVGIEGVNICSPGCENHNFVPARVLERQTIQLIQMALETGAVDAVVSHRSRVIRKLELVKKKVNTEFCFSPEGQYEASTLLNKALRNFKSRGDIVIPEDCLSWRKLILLGIAGGAVPCPDALAILLVSLSLGRLGLGLGIVFAFSFGLALALLMIGMAIIFSKRLFRGFGKAQIISRIIPYLSALFLIGLGLYMIRKNLFL